MSGIISFEHHDEANAAIEADALCKRVGRILVKHYPRRRWHVYVSARGGVIQIMAPAISTEYGYVLHTRLYRNDRALHDAVMRAGGCILEKFKLSRQRGAEGGEQDLLRNLRGNAAQAATGL